MKRSLAALAFLALALVLLFAGCSTAAPTPTQAPAAPTKAAEPTKAAAPATAAPAAAAPSAAAKPAAASSAPAANWPEKGKTINLIIPWTAGGTTDLAGRLLAQFLEKDLGVPVEVVNKPGAASQIGMTEFAKAKPDGYTLAYFMIEDAIAVTLDPERKATFSQKDFDLLGLVGTDPKTVDVRSDSPYKSVADLVNAAKANPGKVTIATSGALSAQDLWAKELMQVTKTDFALVGFPGIADCVTALLGGHVDVSLGSVGSVASGVKDGKLKIISVAAKEPTSLAPGVPTIQSEGFSVYSQLSRVLAAPAGTPDAVTNVLVKSVQKSMQDPALKKAIEGLQMDFSYKDPQQAMAYWDQTAKELGPIIAAPRK